MKSKLSPKKKRKSSLSSLKKKAWTVFSAWIRKRDGGICITCGKKVSGRNYHAGHFISRRHNATLFDERNVNGQCAYCNLYLAGNVPEYSIKIREKWGEGIVEELVAKSHEIKQFTHKELEEIIEKYK